MEEEDILERISRRMKVSISVCHNLVAMLEIEECTVPFIARYRCERTDKMEAEQLRKFQSCLQNYRELQKKAMYYTKLIRQQGKLTERFAKALKNAENLEELNMVYEPFKVTSKRTHAEKAREFGLEIPVIKMMEYPKSKVNFRNYVKKGTVGLATLSEVENGVKYLVADYIAKHENTIKTIRHTFDRKSMTLVSKQAKIRFDIKDSTKKFYKYQNYFDFQIPLNKIKSFQLLAVNRGEAQKCLSVKILINDAAKSSFKEWCRKYFAEQIYFEEHRNLVKECIEDSFERLIKPKVVRRCRSDLTKEAQDFSIQLFSRNLKKLYLTPPVHHKTVFGVDPGFSNGCKCAVVAQDGSVIATEIIYLTKYLESFDRIRSLYLKYAFEVIAIGSGSGCRETEVFFSKLLQKLGNPNLSFCIVSENGASIYSVSAEAKKEFPNLAPNLISAVSIARRFQDPLNELIKYEAKHLGIGQYQHDTNVSKLNKAVDQVVEDCVTLVGVDLNSASTHILNHIAGLKKTQAKNIVEWRQKNGDFINREQLLTVAGIGVKTFQQCAGFLRINHSKQKGKLTEKKQIEEGPINLGVKRKATKSSTQKAKKLKTAWQINPLDRTWIHPESYEQTNDILCSVNMTTNDIGSINFVTKLQQNLIALKKRSAELGIGEPTFRLIFDGLTQPLGYLDIRDTIDSNQHIYRRDVLSLDDMHKKMKLRGRVTNVTEFGIFIDVGIGIDGLMHLSKTKGKWPILKSVIGPNDVIDVEVDEMDKKKNRLQLSLVQAKIGGMIL